MKLKGHMMAFEERSRITFLKIGYNRKYCSFTPPIILVLSTYLTYTKELSASSESTFAILLLDRFTSRWTVL
jgi:hypothetical protein